MCSSGVCAGFNCARHQKHYCWWSAAVWQYREKAEPKPWRRPDCSRRSGKEIPFWEFHMQKHHRIFLSVWCFFFFFSHHPLDLDKRENINGRSSENVLAWLCKPGFTICQHSFANPKYLYSYLKIRIKVRFCFLFVNFCLEGNTKKVILVIRFFVIHFTRHVRILSSIELDPMSEIRRSFSFKLRGFLVLPSSCSASCLLLKLDAGGWI